jgi:hypothetical protein
MGLDAAEGSIVTKLDRPCWTLIDARRTFDAILRMNRVGFAVRNDVDLTRTDLDTVFTAITVLTMDDRIHNHTRH